MTRGDISGEHADQIETLYTSKTAEGLRGNGCRQPRAHKLGVMRLKAVSPRPPRADCHGATGTELLLILLQEQILCILSSRT